MIQIDKRTEQTVVAKTPALEAATEFETLRRPAFYASEPPVFANYDALAAPWRERVKAIVTRREAQLPTAQIVSIRNAIVYQNGYVCTADNSLVEETAHLGAVSNLPDAAVVRCEPGSIVLLRKPGDSNYGHWLVELLPRVREFRAAFPGQRLRFGIPANPKSMATLRRRSLEWLGVAAEDIMLLNTDPVQFDEVIFLTSNSIHSHTHDNLGIEYITERALAQIPYGPATRRLYVARGGDHKRRLLNEAEMRPLLEAHGFEIVYPETLDLDGQVRLFAEAEMVLGVTGAALTNIMWAPRFCEVVSLSPNYGYEFFFWDLACIRQQNFSFVFGQSSDPTQLGHSDFSVDPRLVRQAVEEALGRIATRKVRPIRNGAGTD